MIRYQRFTSGSQLLIVKLFASLLAATAVGSTAQADEVKIWQIQGAGQPFVQAGETEREAQTQALNDYVDSLLADDANARLIVTGDFNTFEFTNDLREILPGATAAGNGNKRWGNKYHRGNGVLTNLVDFLRDDNVYTFIFEGNSQALDQMLVTKNLLYTSQLDIVHVNVDFARVDDSVASDHEPLVGRFYLIDEHLR